MGSQAATTSSLSRASFCRQSSVIRAVCAKERSYGSVRGASGQLASLPRPTHLDGREGLVKRKGVVARQRLKEAWSKHASRWTRTGFEAYGAGRAGKGPRNPIPSKELVVNPAVVRGRRSNL